MNIALIGHGKMGAEVERVAASRNVRVVKIFDIGDNPGGKALTAGTLAGVDVCVEFTVPSAAVGNIEAVAKAGLPIVVGTTGWYDQIDAVKKIIGARGTGLVYAPNFSVGVNILSHLVGRAARLFDRYDMYDAAIRETHHREKADSPSGTALHLGRILLDGIRRIEGVAAGNSDGKIPPGRMNISSTRLGTTVGEHTVAFDSEADTIELTHRAKNRSGFAHGALIAAEWIRGRKGVYTMEDVLTTE